MYNQSNQEKRMANVLILAILLTLFGLIILFRKMKISFTGNKDVLRGTDAQGSGAYGAGRGSRVHNGVDIRSYPGQILKAPFKLKINRYGIVYSDPDKDQFKLVEFVGTGLLKFIKIKLMYVTIEHEAGDILEAGEMLAKAQNIGGFYGGGMINHNHVEIYIMGKRVDPTPFLNV